MYQCQLALWEPPAPSNPISLDLVGNLSDILTERCKKIGRDSFFKERYDKYILEGESEEDAEFLSEADVDNYC